MNAKDLRELIDKALNEIASEEESAALEEQLVKSQEARDQYLNAVNVHAALRQRFSVGEQESLAGNPKAGRSPSKVALLWGAVMGCALASLVIAVYFSSQEPSAIVTQVVGAYDENGDSFEVGDLVESGRLSLSRGLVSLDFSSGAKVTMEGPAQLDVEDGMKVVLHQGVVTAIIPKSAIGFTVDTASAQVVDLGTSFGVSVGKEGLTDVCVFDGEVEVSRSDDTESFLVRGGHAVRARGDSKNIEKVAYETQTFENAWPMNSGVLQTTGGIRFVSPGPDFHPGNYKDNENIVVFPEKRGFVAEEDSRVDLADPGEFARGPYPEKPILKAGRKLTSYLLQLDAYPEGENPNRRRSVRGQITFARPIVGVVTSDRLLKESEAIFGLPNVTYPSARMIEPRPEGDLRPGFDSLILAADRRTLIVELQENPGHLDQVRVLVESE